MEELIKKFRAKVDVDRRTLKWWHGEYYKKAVSLYNVSIKDNKNKPMPEHIPHYKYNYFIRQINTPDSIRPDLKNIITEYVG